MTFKIFRRGSARCIGLLSAFVTILLCLYYISIGQPSVVQQKNLRSFGQLDQNQSNGKQRQERRQPQTIITSNSFADRDPFSAVDNKKSSSSSWANKCYTLKEQETNITAYNEYSQFDFQPEWIRTKEYWDKTFEERYEQQKKDHSRPPLKVIIVPHSHNDPGWLKTFINYFQSDSRQILNLIVTKMQEYTDMTFIWSEISFLQLWWDQAHPTKQRALKRLIKSGRFEITTGGWVMTDEANVHLFPMLDQLIEGHQWLRINLNVTPEVGWSIDPFGHGSTVPYLLSESDFEGTIIQRIHYAWKQWFAKHQSGDFLWVPYWNKDDDSNKNRIPKHSLLTHNMPFDIYSIKHSCGPHPFICLNFDFRKIPGEYTEYSIKAQFITDENVEEKAQLLLEQYSRTASLFPHNVALIPVGDDFRYNKEREVDQQYRNYKKLIDHINANKEIYNVEIGFGTPRDYFREIKKRSEKFNTFKGDFFVYSDIFSEGRPAYWSGYFTTRPFYKILSTDLEHNLRAAEILFTIAYNTARQFKHENAIKVFEKNYEKMILARRNLGLFQHHDAITGTSKSAVMRDYGLRLFESVQDVVKMQESTIELLLQNATSNHNFVLSELERDNYNKLPRKTPISLAENNEASFVVFNALTHKRIEILSIRTTIPNVKILNEANVAVPMQVNPIWNITDNYENPNSMHSERIRISTKQFEIQFLATLEPLSLTTFKIVPDNNYKQQMATIYCDECSDGSKNTEFDVKAKPAGDIQLENNKMRLLFNEKSGFLKTITRKNSGRSMQCAVKFAAYRSAQFHSGAYLFKTDPEQNEAEKDVLEQYEDIRIIITSGPITSDVTVIYGPFLAHTMRIYNTQTYLDSAIYIENDIDFEPPPKNRETELFMRFLTNIENGGETPEFYSDQNGFQFHKRVKISAIGIEGNYFPITSGAFIQDDNLRLTLLTTHAQGAASYEPGQLEVMLDRRTLYDDYRGMGEGIVDSRLTRHKFWLLIEEMAPPIKNKYEVLSTTSNYFANGLRYPPNIYFIENLEIRAPVNLRNKVSLISHSLPCDLHLLNLRTLSDEQLELFPSKSALMILHRQGYDCSIGGGKQVNTIPCDDLSQITTTDSLSKMTLNNLFYRRIPKFKRHSTNLCAIAFPPHIPF
ncbi:alpha-mannosidase 2 isoform X2 [Episyrphus balteatus]|uniref:alpha-mannosidase 2 isoform X2 n=1 Tax=Episyrphus balteatus TaxID=286459 RepID=UPI002485D0C8|nr:alpha-mannosidase 2 isoform X2 [Episyrphus balteatus]